MNQKVKFVIDTVIIACIPFIKTLLDKKVSSIAAYLLSALLASLIILLLERICLMISVRRKGLYGVWYEHITNNKDRPFAVCKFESSLFHEDIRLSGTHFDAKLSDITAVNFFSTHLWHISDNHNGEGFAYINSSSQDSGDKKGMGKYHFSENADGLQVLKGFFVDMVFSNMTMQNSIMYRADEKFYSKLKLDTEEERRDLHKVWEKLQEYEKKQGTNHIDSQS